MSTQVPGPQLRSLAALLAGTEASSTLAGFHGEDQAALLARLDDGQLASLLPMALGCDGLPLTDSARQWAHRILDADAQRQPRLTVAICAAALLRLSRRSTGTRSGALRPVDGVALLARCTEPGHERLQAPALALLQHCGLHAGASVEAGSDALSLLALARCAGADGSGTLASLLDACSAHPLLRDELRLVAHWPLQDLLRHARIAELYPTEADIDPAPADLQPLSEHDTYLQFAEQALQQAAQRLQAIHSGQAPYIADRAFSIAEAGVLWRATRAALECDAPWLRPLLAQVLPPVCVAPTAARTLPSQSVAVALAKAVNAMPTPEAIAALALARSQVRHAGIARKLDRHLAAAERRLAQRPQLLLRLPVIAAGRRSLASLARALEATFVLGGEWALQDWRDACQQPALATLLQGLVWQLADARGHWIDAMPVDGAEAFADAHGIVVALQGRNRLRLWHPARSQPHLRAAWRARLIEQRCRQPLRQVFREHYLDARGEPADTAAFNGLTLSVATLAGLARRQGWHGDDGGQLMLAKGPWRIGWQLSAPLSHGLAGEIRSGRVQFQRRHRDAWQPVQARELPAVVASELLRELDLLASTCACGGEGMPLPPARMVRLRGRTLEHLLAAHPQRDLMTFQRRHVQVGHYRLHLATARASLAGQTLALPDLPARPRRWLPYDDAVLAQLLGRIEQLAERVLTPPEAPIDETVGS